MVLPPIARPISTTLSAMYCDMRMSFSGKSKVIRSSGWPQASL